MKLGLFFGAGAEIGYGLPSGGQFAIDLFRQDPSPYRQKFREKLKRINTRTPYANSWLPKGFEKKNIFVFGKNEFTSIIESSIQYKRQEIISRLNNFDHEFQVACNSLDINITELKALFQKISEKEIGEVLYNQDIKLNEKLATEVKLFGSEYYSACLELLRTQKNNADLKRYSVAFLQLLVGSYGQDFVQNLNEELFETTPDDLPIFDDIYGMFRLEFDRVGSTALDLLLNENRSFNMDTSLEKGNILDVFSAVTQKILENIFCSVLDYQKLIDDHFRYLFTPKTEWAKFTRMAIFLEIAQDYIIKQVPVKLADDGYYHDIKSIIEAGHEVTTIGTANYNSLFQRIACEIDLDCANIQVYHLNGSTHDFYNPYKNEVIQKTDDEAEDNDEQISVPFILTQSGLKPLTSVEMSRRYVELFDSFKKMDVIISIGFGFNQDDSHINGLFRELIEKYDKTIYIITVDPTETIKNLKTKLRLDHNFNNIKIICVDPKTRKTKDKSQLWLEQLITEYSEKLESDEVPNA